MDLAEIPREQAPCQYAIKAAEVFVVNDLLEDDRFRTSPLAQAGIRFYAGAPLLTRAGFGLGTICIVDTMPRQIGEEEQRTLQDLAGMVMTQIEIQNMIGRIDATSGHANQHQLFENLEELAVLEPGQPAAAIAIEIMNSAEVGHALRVLGTIHTETLTRRVLQVLQSILGNSVRVYHVGQMRCVVLGNANGPDATDLARRATSAFATPIVCGSIPVTLAPAIGRYDFTTGEIAPQDVLRRLINAVDDARETSDGHATYCPVQDHQKARSYALLNDFAAALAAEDQLHLVYQPRVALATGRLLGVEALLRWRHPTLGSVAPGEFIPLIEQTALVRSLTEWVVTAAIRQAVDWTRKGLDIAVSVNASARNLDEDGFADRLLSALSRARLPPRLLELEFTESAAARDQASVIGQLRTLHEAGIAIAIDDFGTGYSNVAYIQQMPVSVLKIDRSFITNLGQSVKDRKLVRSMIGMAHDLGYRVVAEGIETQDVYDLLACYQCEEGQGYLMGQPMVARDIEAWLLKSEGHPYRVTA